MSSSLWIPLSNKHTPFDCFCTMSTVDSYLSKLWLCLCLAFCCMPLSLPLSKEAASTAQMDGFLCRFEWIYLPPVEPLVNSPTPSSSPWQASPCWPATYIIYVKISTHSDKDRRLSFNSNNGKIRSVLYMGVIWWTHNVSLVNVWFIFTDLSNR